MCRCSELENADIAESYDDKQLLDCVKEELDILYRLVLKKRYLRDNLELILKPRDKFYKIDTWSFDHSKRVLDVKSEQWIRNPSSFWDQGSQGFEVGSSDHIALSCMIHRFEVLVSFRLRRGSSTIEKDGLKYDLLASSLGYGIMFLFEKDILAAWEKYLIPVAFKSAITRLSQTQVAVIGKQYDNLALDVIAAYPFSSRVVAYNQGIPSPEQSSRKRNISNTLAPCQPWPAAADAHICDSNSALLALFYSLGQPLIHRDVLFRGLLPQKRWSDNGNICEMRLHELDDKIAGIFLNKTSLEETIQSCISLNLIVQGSSVDGMPVYHIKDRSCVPQSFGGMDIYVPGLVFVTHIFPRDQNLEPSFQDIGELLLPYLQHAWSYVEEKKPTLPANLRNSLIEASLAAFRLTVTSHIDVLTGLKEQIGDPDLPNHLRMAIANQESISLRLRGSHDQSDAVIDGILDKVNLNSTDIRSHCLYGRLLLSRTENAVMRKEFGQARDYLLDWEVRNDPPSALEIQVIRLKNTVYGRVLRYLGNFSHARECLETCLKIIPNDTSRYHVMHHLGDIYCELGNYNKVEELALAEFDKVKAVGKQRFRRLALPLVEAYIEQGKLREAMNILSQLLCSYRSLSNPVVADQLGHVRSMIGLARVYYQETQWFDTHQYLKEALSLTERYNTFSRGNFYIGTIYLFLAIVEFDLCEYPMSQMSASSAKEILCKEPRRHFMPGIGSYFFDHLLHRGGSIAWLRAWLQDL